MLSLSKDVNTVGQLRDALKDIPDDAFLNIGNQSNGFSVDEIHYDGLSVALETKEEGVFEPLTEGKIESAKQCLIDNGFEAEDAETVLQALGYILLNCELFPEKEAKEIAPSIEPEIGMRGTIACSYGVVKKSLWGKSFTVVGLNEGYATCSIEGKAGTYAVPFSVMENLSYNEKEGSKEPLSSKIQSASARRAEPGESFSAQALSR